MVDLRRRQVVTLSFYRPVLVTSYKWRDSRPSYVLQQLYLDINRLVALAYPSTEQVLVCQVAKETSLGIG